jgi:hypothetical protein
MGSEVAFNAAKGAYGTYGALLKDIAQEVGMERALALHARRGEGYGAMVAGMIKDELGDEEFNMQALASVLSGITEEGGLIAKVEGTQTSATCEVFECPLYEGLKMAGWSHEDIEKTCNCFGAAERNELQKSYPQLSASLKFRSAPDQSCVEEFLWEH